MGNYNFYEDLNQEEKNKHVVMDMFVKKGYQILGDNNTCDYDLIVKNKSGLHVLELKEDFKAKDTGNVAIEYYSRGKPSGIRTTLANFYFYTVHYDNGIKYWVAPVKILKQFFKDSFDYTTVIGGDKGSDTRMYLLKLETFEKLCKEFK